MFIDIINWILSLLGLDPIVWKPVTIGAHVYMPLFYPDGGGIGMTWNYLARSDGARKALRDHIKANAKSGETPAITFCLTPRNVNGGLLENNMLAVGDDALGTLESRCQELVKDGIAVFPCLYVDDSEPRWMSIEAHRAIWSRIHGRICKYVSGYILSIESNEMANSVSHLNGCITAMKAAMPGAEYYGSHLQWKSGGRYSWNGGGSTPSSANIILVETSNDPHNGDAFGVSGVLREYDEIKASNPGLKFVMHEFNTNAMSAVGKAQTEALRERGAWGVA